MKTITVADTLELSISERIQLVEDIWDTIATEIQSIELTEDEKRIIDERLKAYHKNPTIGSPWEEVYKRIMYDIDEAENIISYTVKSTTAE